MNKDLTKLENVIADNKERWAQSLAYIMDDEIEDQWGVAKAHIDFIFDDLVNKLTGKGD